MLSVTRHPVAVSALEEFVGVSSLLGLLSSPLGEFASALRAQLPFIPLLIIAGVAVAAVVAVVFSDRPGVRPAFLAGFFTVLVVVNVVGLPVLPFMHWQKFSDVSDSEMTFSDFRVVTADGAEVQFDPRSVTNVDGVYMVLVTHEMQTADDERRAELSAYMLERARIHRTKVETRSPLHYLRFPPHTLSEWTVAELDGHAPFVGIRVYERTLVFTDDGARVVSDTETLVFEYIERGDETAAAQATAYPVAQVTAYPVAQVTMSPATPLETARTSVPQTVSAGGVR